MEKTQTAVEWLVEKLQKHYTNIDIENTVVFQQAKEMEKEQIKDAWLSSWKDSMLNPLSDEHYQELADDYYNETYGSK